MLGLLLVSAALVMLSQAALAASVIRAMRSVARSANRPSPELEDSLAEAMAELCARPAPNSIPVRDARRRRRSLRMSTRRDELALALTSLQVLTDRPGPPRSARITGELTLQRRRREAFHSVARTRRADSTTLDVHPRKVRWAGDGTKAANRCRYRQPRDVAARSRNWLFLTGRLHGGRPTATAGLSAAGSPCS